MFIRPQPEDLKVILLHSGHVITGLGCLMCLPLATAMIAGEFVPAADFAVGVGACLVFGQASALLAETARELTWRTGMVTAAFSWLLACVFGAIPSFLSGHYGSFLDAMFDVMSGLTTTGLYLLCDLDHASDALNMWRHALTFAGGQGIVVLMLALVFGRTGGAYSLYVGEGKEERLLPSVFRTARAIWLVSLVWLAVGTLALWAAAVACGLPLGRAFLHALWVYMGAWSTGGFAPTSYNILYYHSPAFEAVCAAVMIAGSFNFALHWAVWTGDRREVRRNVEVVSFSVTMTVALFLTSYGLARVGVYPGLATLFRKAFFQVVSGHTTTGFSTVYAQSLVRQWGPLAMAGLVLAMAVGASSCSTGGGFKGLRVGLLAKGFAHEARRLVSPARAIVTTRWHHLHDRLLSEDALRQAMMIVLAYIVTYSAGALAGVLSGYAPMDALFDSVSAGSNTGLTCGVTSPAMPIALKTIYILQMWAGRLEFASGLALGGFLWALVRGR